MPSARKLLEPYLAGGYERENGDLDLHCPIHGDKRRSATVNFKTGEWYCQACEEGGSLEGLIARRAEWDAPPTPNGTTSTKKGRKWDLPDSARLNGWQSALLSNESALDWLETQRGLSADTIQRFGLGWDGRRYTMPVYDELGRLQNIRCYSNVLDPKIINWTGWGSPPRLYPMSVLLQDPKIIWICEGEFDALLANQQGVTAVTGTGGVKSTGRWREDWSEWFRGRSIFVCFDRDRDGDLNARRVIKKLTRFARKIQYIELPFPMGSGKDVTDFILDGGSLSGLRKSAKQPKAVKKAAPRYHTIDYEDLREGKNIEKASRVEATLTSVFRSQLSLPVKLNADCNVDWDPKRCAVCPMSQKDGKMSHSVEYDHDLHVDMMSVGKSEERDRRFKREMNIPVACNMVDVKADYKSAWDAEIRNGSDLQEQAFPVLLFTEREMPPLNHLYNLSGITVASPQGGKTIFIARKYESAKQDLDNFEPDEKSITKAREWIDSFAGTSDEKISAISEHFENHVTGIYGQRFLHMAMDLVYHSILDFEFRGTRLPRAWMEMLAVGQTRSGKSTTAQELQKAYGYGQLKSGENTSVAGLLGGVEKKASLTRDGAWAITAGELPLCDRRLLVIDEAQGLPVKDIAQMSDVRSRGVVDIRKIRAMKLNARVRLVWLSNKRKPSYRHGIDALADQMGAHEDLARIDIPIYVLHDAGEELDEKLKTPVKRLSTEELGVISWLVLWTWSRRFDQVRFSPAAEEAVYDLRKDLTQDFSTMELPIFPENEAHVRLARMSAAVAARLFSTADGHILSVRAEHVEGAFELYRKFLSDEELGVIEIKDDEAAIEGAASKYSGDLREFLKMAGPELIRKMADGTFNKHMYGSDSETRVLMSQLFTWKAVTGNGDPYAVSKWAQDVAKEIEKESRR